MGDAQAELAAVDAGLEIADTSSDSTSLPADAGLDGANADHPELIEDAADAADATWE
jgi:hypothetical protein